MWSPVYDRLQIHFSVATQIRFMSSTASGDILSSTPLPAPDYPPLRASPPSFRDATEEERNLREQLVGRRVSIYWEGDSVFYPGKVVDYDEMNQLYKVQYDEGDEPPYDEDLSNLPRWMIFEGTEADYTAFVQQKVNFDSFLLIRTCIWKLLKY